MAKITMPGGMNVAMKRAAVAAGMKGFKKGGTMPNPATELPVRSGAGGVAKKKNTGS